MPHDPVLHATLTRHSGSAPKIAEKYNIILLFWKFFSLISDLMITTAQSRRLIALTICSGLNKSGHDDRLINQPKPIKEQGHDSRRRAFDTTVARMIKAQ